jgi:hypothetical protein
MELTQTTGSFDSSPKWFTTVDLDGHARTNESTLHYLPRLEYDDSQFVRVQFEQADPRVTPSPIPA